MNQRERILGAVIEREDIDFRLEIWAYRELTPAESASCLDAYLRQFGKPARSGVRARMNTLHGLEPGL